MEFSRARLGLLLLVVSLCGACSAARDTRLPSERLLAGCSTDAQCGTNAFCQDGLCVSSDGASVTGKVAGAPSGTHVSSEPVGDEVCDLHGDQGLICTLTPGGRVVLLAPQIANYRFVGWTGQGCTNGETSLDLQHITAPMVCTANYAQRLRASGTVDGDAAAAVTATSSSPSAVCQGNACQVDADQPVQLAAPLRDGFRLTGWDGDGCPMASSYEITVTPVDKDISCVAHYESALTARGQAQGVTAGTPVGIVASSTSPNASCVGPLCALDPGSDASLAAPMLTGYRFSGWTGEERCLSNDSALTISNITSSVVCTADYVQRFNVQAVSAGVDAPAGVLQASSNSPFASCAGAACSIDHNQDATLIAGTVPGYRFQSWSGLGCSASNGAAAEAKDVTGDVTCTAFYVPGVSVTGTVVNAEGVVDARSMDLGAACANGSCAISSGGSAALTVPVIPGRTFLNWAGDDGCSGLNATVAFSNVTSSKNCLAIFALRDSAEGRPVPAAGGSVVASSNAGNASCTGARCEVDRGSPVALLATPSANYRFTGWSGDALCTGAQSTLDLAVTKEIACNANFVARVTVSGLASPADAGSVSARQPSASAQCSGASCTVDVGSDVSLNAQPAPGYSFTGWTGCGDPSASSTLTVSGVTANQQCTANFQKLSYLVGAVAGTGGSVSAQASGVACANATCSVSYGASVSLQAMPAVGYAFSSWSGAGCSGSNPEFDIASVHMAQTCTANFARIRVVLSGASVPAGVAAISANSAAANAACSASSCTLDYGSAASLSAPALVAGYRFASWTGCLGGSVNGTGLSFANLSANTNCQANYIRQWTVTGVSNDPNEGSTTCMSGCVVDQGGSVMVSATPRSGYRFLSWSCSPSSSDTILVSNVSADVQCVATFMAIPQ